VRTLVLAAVIAASAACGAGSTTTTTVTGPTTTVTETVTTPSGSSAQPPGGSTGSGTTITAPSSTPVRLRTLCGTAVACDDFVTPSGNIICFASARQHGYVECAIKSGLVPPPPRDGCDLDQPGLQVASTGDSRPSCRSDPTPAWFDKKIPSLAYGTTWKGYGVDCLSQQVGLRCTNRDGRGFVLARQRWSLF
jgi:hypothetical protein